MNLYLSWIELSPSGNLPVYFLEATFTHPGGPYLSQLALSALKSWGTKGTVALQGTTFLLSSFQSPEYAHLVSKFVTRVSKIQYHI